MPVHVFTDSQIVDHDEADKAHWNDLGFLEVYSGERVAAVYAPGRWDHVTVDAAEMRPQITVNFSGDAATALVPIADALRLAIDLNDGKGI